MALNAHLAKYGWGSTPRPTVGQRFTNRAPDLQWTDETGTKRQHSRVFDCLVSAVTDTGFDYTVESVIEEANRPTTFDAGTPKSGGIAAFVVAKYVASGEIIWA